MLSFDGERSKKKKWFAEKQIKICKTIDIPGKVLKWDDFTIRVWQNDGLSGGRITAPMGAVVMCSNGTDIKISVADYWAGGFSTMSTINSLSYPVNGSEPEVRVLNAPTEEEAVAGGNSTFEFKTMTTWSPFGLVDGHTITHDTVWVDDYRSQPGIMPYKGEYFWVTVNDRAMIDKNGDGFADFQKYILDSSLTFYNSNGDFLSGRRDVSLQVGGGTPPAGDGVAWEILQQVSPTKQMVYNSSRYQYDWPDILCGYRFEHPSYSAILLSKVLPAGFMPDALRTILLNPSNVRIASWPLGGYACHMDDKEVFLHMNNSTNVPPHWAANNPTAVYFSSNPSEIKWKMWVSWMVDGVATVINTDQFIDLFDSVATVEIKTSSGGVNWKNVWRMSEQLFPYPMASWAAPYDSVMFHDNEYIYTWTRKYGGFRFSSTGIHAQSINVPAWEEGVRPDIHYCGTFEGEKLYLCISNKVKEGIKGVYYGSPFDSWTQLPHIDGLFHVRPVKVTPDDIFLIGIVKKTVVVDSVPKEVYCFASFFGNKWREMGVLPFDVGEDNLQIALFGEDKLVGSMAEFQLPIPPQIPVGPYDKYAIGVP